METHHRTPVVLLSALILTLSLSPSAAPQRAHAATSPVIRYVTPDGSSDGLSWSTATTLTAALQAANAGDQIWVAQGTYKPTSGTDRTASFQLKSGVAVYGGFVGNETLLSQRDWANYFVLLSGDLNGDDGPDASVNGDNSYHVVMGATGATLDGVFIMGGNANGSSPPNNQGGGIYNLGSSPALNNITLSFNNAHYGGGIANYQSSNPTLNNVTLIYNNAHYGGGIANSQSSPILSKVTLRTNNADTGGGMYSDLNSSSVLTAVTFSGNFATNGGGMYNRQSSPVLTDVTFSGNSATNGGGMYNDFNSRPVLTNSTFSDNGAGEGGGMYNQSSSPVLTNVVLNSNKAVSNGGGMNNAGGTPVLTNVVFKKNVALYGGGVFNSSSNPVLTSVMISGNTATRNGGGIANFSSSNPILTNTTISGNAATTNGGGVFNSYSGLTLTNVTLSGNSALSGGGVFNYQSSPQVRNSILWGDRGGEIVNTNSSMTTTSSSIVQGGYVTGTHVLNLDPQFTAPVSATSAPTTTGDLHLQARSPAIEAGDPAVTNPKLPATDIDSHPRVIGRSVDIGAYEALPQVTAIMRAAPNPTSAAAVPFTVTFNLPVSGVRASDFGLTTSGGQGGASVSGISGSGTIWTVTVASIAAAEGTLRLDLHDTDTITATTGITASDSIPLGGVGTGNGDFSAGEIYTIDRVAPLVRLTTPAVIALANQANYSVNGTCTTGDGRVHVQVGTIIGSASCTTNAFSATLDATGLADGTGLTVSISQTDALGNLGAANATTTKDTVGPGVTLVASAPEPTNHSPITVTVTFDESVNDFTVADLEVSNAAISTFNGSGTSYRFEMSPIGQGAVTVDLAAGAAHDTAGNPSRAAMQLHRTYDSVTPVVNLAMPPHIARANHETYAINGSFSTSDANVHVWVGEVSSSTLCVSGVFSATLDVSSLTDGTDISVSVRQSDAAGNTGIASGTTAKDTVAPVVSFAPPVMINQANQAIYLVHGSCVGGDGQVSVQIGSASGNASCITNSFSVTLDVSNLADGTGISMIVQQIDAFGNTGIATTTNTKDSVAPTVVRLEAPDIRLAGATLYTFNVTYQDANAVAHLCLGDGNVSVRGPDGVVRAAVFVSATPAGDNTSLTATYTLAPPGGAWDAADDGVYRIALEANQIVDTADNTAAATELGSFRASVASEHRIFLPHIAR